MNKRSVLQRKLGSLQFSLWELHLYLDTHPDDTAAKARYDFYKVSYEKVRSEYTNLYGPLSPMDASGKAWLKAPWPWEEKECDE